MLNLHHPFFVLALLSEPEMQLDECSVRGLESAPPKLLLLLASSSFGPSIRRLLHCKRTGIPQASQAYDRSRIRTARKYPVLPSVRNL
jgi:hypothetical protein